MLLIYFEISDSTSLSLTAALVTTRPCNISYGSSNDVSDSPVMNLTPR
jgi:hypothetical protein